MEAIFAGKKLEYIPYMDKFDEGSEACVLKPGQVVWWESCAPYRVENNEMCVSLNCSYRTRASVKRSNIQRANHYMMRNLKINKPSVSETGLMADIKEFAYRSSNRLLNYKPKDNFRDDYATSLILDASNPNYIVQSKLPRMPAFLQYNQSL